MKNQDEQFMARAIEVAQQGRFWASPNPHVGCVVVREGRIVGEGFTQPPGGNHAEIQALLDAGDARGATAYVTLEPCAHFGRTGPCADALIAAGLSRVVVAVEDPFHAVSGQGIARLREAGVAVSVGVLADESRALIAGYLLRITRGWGRVRLKLATSLDGRTAMASGESQWITGPQARADVQRLRAESSVIVTGIGTVLADDCALTLRAEQLPLTPAECDRALTHAPLRVLLDSEGRLRQGSQIISDAAPTLIFHADNTVPAPFLAAIPTVKTQPVSRGTHGLDLRAILTHLGEEGANEILIEAGATLAAAFIEQNLVDELVIYQAPRLLGSSGKAMLALSFDRLAETPELRLIEVSRVGDDLRIIATPT